MDQISGQMENNRWIVELVELEKGRRIWKDRATLVIKNFNFKKEKDRVPRSD